MDWKILLAYITGSVDQELLLRHERNNQGKGNVLLFPAVNQAAARQGLMQCRERLGGLLKYYTYVAA